MPDQDTQSRSLVSFLKQENGKPYLAGSKCRACGHVYVGERSVCAKCSVRDQMDAVQLSETGKVYVYTIVHRSFPGVETPFIDVIVDLDDGAHIKGTLINHEADPENIPFGLPVRVVYREVVPPGGSGNTYLSYAFAPITTVKGASR